MKITKRRKNEFVHFQVKRDDNVNNSHAVHVILCSIDNVIEGEKAEENGNILQGVIRNYVLPKLNLSIGSSKRTVLNIMDCDDEIMDTNLNTKKVQMLDFD